MLNLLAVKDQVDRMVRDRRVVQGDYESRLALALEELERQSVDWPGLGAKVDVSRTSWLLPAICESPTRTYPRPPRPHQISIAATDGSQIFPDRHEVAACFLINIGYVLLHYGTGEKPLMNSLPSLYYGDAQEDWEGHRIYPNRDSVGLRRTTMEFTEVAELAVAAQQEGHQVVALADGTLILWSLEGKPQELRELVLEAHLRAFEQLRRNRIPVAGYISKSGGRDLTNALRLGLCPLEAPDCDRCPWREGAIEPGDAELPCGAIGGIDDGILLRQSLTVGQRTPAFASRSKILEAYGDHHVWFFYVHVGREIARVEVPQWVAEDDQLLDLVHACACDQAEKGNGYPVALSEAHEQAIVRGRDRERFYALVEESLVRGDLGAGLSTKSASKRTAVV